MKMKKRIINGWLEVDKDAFWAHHRKGKWTGLTIAKIPPWPPEKPKYPRTVYHVRFYYSSGKSRRDRDIGNRPSLRQAKQLAESYLTRSPHNVL